MKILITGGTGLLGTHLQSYFAAQEHEVLVLSRKDRRHLNTNYITYHEWDGKQIDAELGPVDVVINLAGAGIADKKWTASYKQEILNSRINATKACTEFIQAQSDKPQVFISVSAVGYYGTEQKKKLTEADGPGHDFLAKTSVKWEKASHGTGVRTVNPRIGIVMAKDGGAFPRLLKPFKFYAGAWLGNGHQPFPWIHIDDVCRLMDFVIHNEQIEGPVNFAAPNFQTNKSFAKMLGQKIGIPVMMGIPEFMVKTMLGERAIILTEGQYVLPKKAQDHGFQFKYPKASEALDDLLKDNPQAAPELVKSSEQAQ
jgi:hypothetical protein